MRMFTSRIFQILRWPVGRQCPVSRRQTVSTDAGACLSECGQCFGECMLGQELEILSLSDKLCCAQRLRELGILEGETVVVLKNSDPIVLLAKNSRIALERSAARKIRVRRASRNPGRNPHESAA